MHDEMQLLRREAARLQAAEQDAVEQVTAATAELENTKSALTRKCRQVEDLQMEIEAVRTECKEEVKSIQAKCEQAMGAEQVCTGQTEGLSTCRGD
jgi:predicted  nucleic acid-binding Zn-ribbon protein